MPTAETQPTRSFAPIAALLLLFGTALGVVLLVLDAPLWVFYVAPLSGLPLLLVLLSSGAPGYPYPPRPPAPRRAAQPLRVLFRGQVEALLTSSVRDLGRRYLLLSVGLLAGVAVTAALFAGSDSADAPLVPILIAVGVLFILSLATHLLALREHRALREVVFLEEQGWSVRSRRGLRNSRYTTKEEAASVARAQLRRAGGGELVVRDPDGSIRNRDTVGPELEEHDPEAEHHGVTG